MEDKDNAPVEGVKVNFALATPGVGYIDNNEVYSDENGYAEVNYHISPNDVLSYGQDNADIQIVVSIPESITCFDEDWSGDIDDCNNSGEYQKSLNRIYILESPAVENIELHITPDTLTYNDIPNSSQSDTLYVSLHFFTNQPNDSSMP